jgi:hypothetical protein
MFTLEYANTPVYGNVEGTNIQLIVKWAEFNEEMPFGATSYDSMPHGVDLYNRALAGEFGAVAPYVPPLPLVSANNQPTTTGSQNL